MAVGTSSVDCPCRCAVGIVVAGIFYLNHTRVSARFKNIHIGVTCLPKSNLLGGIDYIDGRAYEPCVALVLFHTRSKCQQLVTVCIQIDAGFPCPTVEVVQYYAVKRKFKAFVLGLPYVCHVAGYARCGRKIYAEQKIFGIGYIILKCTGQAAVQQGEVRTVVPCGGVFPS
ncbi:hypothetical protein Barb7_03191 [Bacteroidales bacterium Barb7]|nr:hypothetical protein Barb7_03191 [Bacteroidales bacterium Barb7]